MKQSIIKKLCILGMSIFALTACGVQTEPAKDKVNAETEEATDVAESATSEDVVTSEKDITYESIEPFYDEEGKTLQLKANEPYGPLIPYFTKGYAPAGGGTDYVWQMGLMTEDKRMVTNGFDKLSAGMDAYGYPIWVGCLAGRMAPRTYFICAQDGSWGHTIETGTDVQVLHISDNGLLCYTEDDGVRIYKIGREMELETALTEDVIAQMGFPETAKTGVGYYEKDIQSFSVSISYQSDVDENIDTEVYFDTVALEWTTQIPNKNRQLPYVEQDTETGLYGYRNPDGTWACAPQYVEADEFVKNYGYIEPNGYTTARETNGTACVLNSSGTVILRRSNGIFKNTGNEYFEFIGDDTADNGWVNIHDGKIYDTAFENTDGHLWLYEDGILKYVDSIGEVIELPLEADMVSLQGHDTLSGSCAPYYYENMIYVEKDNQEFFYDYEGNQVCGGEQVEIIRSASDEKDFYYSALEEGQLKLYDRNGEFIMNLEGDWVIGIYGDAVYTKDSGAHIRIGVTMEGTVFYRGSSV